MSGTSSIECERHHGSTSMGCAQEGELLSERQVNGIVAAARGGGRVLGLHVAPAGDGLAGFMGEHFRVTLRLRDARELRVFVKAVPRHNAPKADFIHKNHFNVRESLVFKYIAESGAADEEDPWCAQAYIHNEDILVMPDLSVQGYASRPSEEYLDLAHVRVAMRSVARMHATLANLFTRKNQTESERKSLLADLEYATADPTFRDSPWLRAAAKLTANLFREFSSHRDLITENFEEDIYEKFLEGCAELREHPDTLNVLVHKDLWTNNIMFRQRGGAPASAVLIDYQCVRYGPPAFDAVSLLYLTTSRALRREHEAELLRYYYSVFTAHVDAATAARLRGLGYDLEAFLRLCERARKFCTMHALSIFPFVLMEPRAAQATFDDPRTFTQYLEVDRSAPVLERARSSPRYRHRQLDLTEEFVDRFLR